MGEMLVTAAPKSGVIVSKRTAEEVLQRIADAHEAASGAIRAGQLTVSPQKKSFYLYIKNSSLVFTTVRGTIVNHAEGGSHIKYQTFDELSLAKMALAPGLLIGFVSIALMNPVHTFKGILVDFSLVVIPVLVFSFIYWLKVKLENGPSINETTREQVLQLLKQAAELEGGKP